MSVEPLARNKRRTVWLLSLLVLGMFGFGFALVPLYDLFCEVTGIQSISIRNSGSDYADPANQQQADESRWVTVKFDTSVHPDLPWQFAAVERSLRVHPGKLYQVNFAAHNRSRDTTIGQAIPSVVPWQATPFLNKLECFCFNQQTLAGGASVDMPLTFMISRDLPKDVHSVTLSYSLLRLESEIDPAKRATEG